MSPRRKVSYAVIGIGAMLALVWGIATLGGGWSVGLTGGCLWVSRPGKLLAELVAEPINGRILSGTLSKSEVLTVVATPGTKLDESYLRAARRHGLVVVVLTPVQEQMGRG